jgi:hypothetical protein
LITEAANTPMKGWQIGNTRHPICPAGQRGGQRLDPRDLQPHRAESGRPPPGQTPICQPGPIRADQRTQLADDRGGLLLTQSAVTGRQLVEIAHNEGLNCRPGYLFAISCPSPLFVILFGMQLFSNLIQSFCSPLLLFGMRMNNIHVKNYIYFTNAFKAVEEYCHRREVGNSLGLVLPLFKIILQCAAWG